MPTTYDRMGAVTRATRQKVDEIAEWSARHSRPLFVVWGKDSNPNNSEHYSGRAADFMTFSNANLSAHDRAIGDGIVDYILTHRKRLGVVGMIWRQRIIGYSGSWMTWRHMADRGNSTANHYDHVHVLFSSKAYAKGGTPKVVKPATTGRGWYHVDPAKVSTFLFGLSKSGRIKLRRRPGHNLHMQKVVTRFGRQNGVTSHGTYYALSYLKRGKK